MKRKEYVYIGTFREEDDANKAAYSGKFWGNVIKQEVK